MRTRDELRAEIDALDSRLLELLSERARLAVEIARLKRREGVEVLDRERERAVVGRACAANPGPLDRRSVARIFRTIMRESRILQLKTVKPQRTQ